MMKIRHIGEIAKGLPLDQAIECMVKAIKEEKLKTMTVRDLIDNKIFSENQLRNAGPNVLCPRGMKASFSKTGESFADEDYFLKSSTYFVHQKDLDKWLNTA